MMGAGSGIDALASPAWKQALRAVTREFASTVLPGVVSLPGHGSTKPANFLS